MASVKERLEADAAKPAPTPEERRAKYEADLKKHAENRKKVLDAKVKAAHDHVTHANEVAASHQKEVNAEALQLKKALQKKQEWAHQLREECLKYKADKATVEVVKSFMIADANKEQESLTAERLANEIEKGQEIAAKNRAALEQYKKVRAGAEGEHAKEVHDYKLLRDDVARTAMEHSMDAHQEAADHLRNMLLLHKQTKASAEVEHAEEVHDAHAALQEQGAAARERHVNVCGEEGLGRSLEVEEEIATGMRMWVTYGDLALHLEMLEDFLAEHERILSEFFELGN